MRKISAALAFMAIAPAAALATVPGEVVINEAMITGVGTDNQEFVELKGPALHDLSDCELVFFNGGSVGGPAYRTFPLTGQTIPADGYFVVAGAITNVPTADYVPGPATDWLQNGDPDSIVLRRTADQVVIDALGYFATHPLGVATHPNLDATKYEGEITGLGGDDVFPTQTGTGARDSTGVLGEANTNASIGRFPDGVDTNNNYNDFSILYGRTPGASNAGAPTLALPSSEDFNSSTGLNLLWSPSFAPMIFETPGTALPAGVPASPDPLTPTQWISIADPPGGDGAGILAIGTDYHVTVYAYNAPTTATSEYVGLVTRLNVLQNNVTFNFDQDFDNDTDFGTAYGDAYYGLTMNMTNDTVQAHKVRKNLRTNVGAAVSVTDGTWVKLEVICNDTAVVYEVNDVQVGLLTGEAPRAGYVALGYYESATSDGLARGNFDALSITAPAPGAAVGDWSILN